LVKNRLPFILASFLYFLPDCFMSGSWCVTSPKEWITNFLTARAKSLLDSREDHTVQQISNLLGFGEQSSFARFFKKETGMTPKEYRSRRG